MECNSCGHENPTKAKFCLECGHAFARRCRNCDTELPTEAKFCLECGTATSVPAATSQERAPLTYTPKHLADKILQSKSALEGERKQVTVMFVDVKSSMELAEQLDPEDWHKILDRFFEIITEGVHRFEGTVNQYTGDGIMALFGAPIAHEDHAQRACYSALHLRTALREYANAVRLRHGVPFGLRIGLNSGEVVVGKIGDDLRMDYTAQGHTVGLAQRMEAFAESGHICLTENTQRLIEGYFNLHDLGRTRVKGVSDEISIYDLEGVGMMRTRLDRSRARGLSKFVGRDDEFRLLSYALEKSRAGSGQVVGVVAEAGTGKSRLCAEFVESCRAKGVPVLEGRGVAHGKSIPMLPMLQLWRAFYEIEEDDGPETVRAKIAGRLLMMDESFRESLPLLFDLFGVPDPANPSPALDPDQRQRRLHGLVKRVLHDPSFGSGTRVFLLEDLHWFDGASDSFLETTIESVPAARDLWIVNFRPEYQAGWLQRSYYHHLPLQPLSAEAIRALLRDHLGDDPSTASLPEVIREQTKGNPFFIEEVVQSLVENGHLTGSRGAYKLTTPIASLNVPPTVQALLSARIDRLAEREKSVLQTASIIGKTFPEQLLSQVMTRVSDLTEVELSESLSNLVAAEFLFESALYPLLEYSFKHPLTQEVAQGSQLRERRINVHAAVASALEESGGNLDERAAEIAQHWAEAEDGARAAQWYRRAAEWAGLSDPREALTHWRRVRILASKLEHSPERAALSLSACNEILSLGWRMGGTEEEAAAVFSEGRALVESSGDRPALALLLGRYGLIRYSVAGSGHDYALYAEEAAALAQDCDDSELLAIVGQFAAFGNWSSGNARRVLDWANRVEEAVGSNPNAGRDVLGYSPLASGMAARVDSLINLGQLDEAEGRGRELEQLTEETRNLEVWTWLMSFLSRLDSIRGVREFPLEKAFRCLEVSEQLDNNSSRQCAYIALGFAHLMASNWTQARDASREGIAIGNDHNTQRAVLPRLFAQLADAHLALGELTEAQAAAREGVEIGRIGGCRYFEIEPQLALARVLLASDSVEAIGDVEAALDRAEKLAIEVEALSLSPQIMETRARFVADRGNMEESSRLLHQALDSYRTIGATGHAARLETKLRL